MGTFLLLLASIVIAAHTIPTVVSNPAFHPHHFSNGVIQLIIEANQHHGQCDPHEKNCYGQRPFACEAKQHHGQLCYGCNPIGYIFPFAYTEEMLREIDSRPEFQLSETQYALLRQRMKALYDHIRHHPALHQRYLWVGKGRPTIDPNIGSPSQSTRQQSRTSSKRKRYLSENTSDQSHEEKPVQKKSKASFPAEEICKTNRLWEQINSTHDFYDNEVEVIQDNVQQYVFSYRCVAETGPCIGISPLYESECTERYGWMYMYYRRVDDPYRTPQWGFVAAPHHCACKITPKYISDS